MSERAQGERRSKAPWLALAALVVGGVLALALRGRGSHQLAPLVPGATGAADASLDPAPASALQRASQDPPESLATSSASSAPRVVATGFPDDAWWIEGRVSFPPGTPRDEELVVVARSSRRFEGHVGPDARSTRAQVDERGRFRAAFSPAAGRGTLRLEGRYLHLASPVDVERLDAVPQMVLEPELGGRIRVRLLPPDARGFEPGDLDGARVRAYSSGDPEGQHLAVVAADGTSTLDGLRAGTAWTLSFDLPGLVDGWREGIEVRPGEVTEVEHAARRGVRVRGRVVDERGRALARARVSASSDGEEGWKVRDPVRTDDAGSFDLRGIGPGELSLEAHVPGRLTATASLGARIEGERLDGVELTLSSGLALAGIVRWPDGTPVEGARVLVSRDGEEPGWIDVERGLHVETGADGRFRVTGLEAGGHAVRASARRAELGAQRLPAKRRELASAPLARAEVAGVPAGTLELALTLESGHVARGRVVDERGRPVERFRIRAWPLDEENRDASGFVSQSFDRADGTFELAGLAAGRHWLRADARGFLASDEHLHPTEAGGELVIALLRPATIEGTVLDPHGAEAHGARVEFRTEEVEWVAVTGSLGVGTRPGADSTETTRNGAFRFAKVTPGRVKLYAESDVHGASEPLVLEVAPGEERSGIVLRLRAPARIHGQVHPHQGRVEGRVVTLAGPERSFETTRTDGAGRFAFEGLSPGEYDVALKQALAAGASGVLELGLARSGEEGLVDRVELTLAAGQSADVVLGAPPADPIRVFGRVTEGGAPAPGWPIACLRAQDRWDGGPAVRTVSDEQGEYELVVDGPGAYQVRFGADWSEAHTETVDLERGVDRRLDVELPTGRIAGVVVGPDGPLASVDVNVTMMRAAKGRTGGVGRTVESDADGRFEATRLPAGTYTVQAGVDGADEGEVDDPTALARVVLHGIELGPGASRSDVRLELAPGGGIEGVALDASGAPLAGARLWFRDPEGTDLFPQQGHRADSTGRFRAAPLRPGPVHVRAQRGETVTGTRIVDVPQGGVARVELRPEG